MLGLILCGGQSSRMGRDKGLILSGESTWASMAAEKFAPLQLPVFFSVNAQQYDAYATNFGRTRLITDDSSLPFSGPLAGLLSMHLAHPGQDLLVLACDMLFIESNFLRRLITTFEEFPSQEAYVFSNDGNMEPLCAVYTAKGMALLVQKLRAGTLQRHSMKYAVEQLNTFFIPLEANEQPAFRNFNSPADLSTE